MLKREANQLDDISRRMFMEHLARTALGVSALSSFAPAEQEIIISERPSAPKKIIYLFMSGGMSQLDTFDPKPGHENMGSTKAIATNVDGIQYSQYLPKLSQMADRLALIKTVSTTAGAHGPGDYELHTAYRQRSTIRHPGIGAWALKFKGKINTDLPGSVYIGSQSRIHGGAGFFDSDVMPVMINDPDRGLRYSSRHEEMTPKMFDRAMALSQELDREYIQKHHSSKCDAHTQMYTSAQELMQSKDLAAFDLQQEPKAVLAKYGDNPFGKGCCLARRLIEHDVRSVEVCLPGWDTHSNNWIHTPDNAKVLDVALSALLQDLEERDQLKDTLVVIATEFGRTPKINLNVGRDHYPQAFTCALAGGDVKGGTVHGVTSPSGEKILEGEVLIKDFNATLGYALGLPLAQPLFSSSVRPFYVGDKGKPVTTLFG
jgi:hypothetical protein